MPLDFSERADISETELNKFQWISVEDRLPEHQQVVLIYKKVPSNTGFLVAYFIDSVKMNEEMRKTPFANECVDIEKNPYYFASREQQRFTIKDVTHWMPLPEPPDGDQNL